VGTGLLAGLTMVELTGSLDAAWLAILAFQLTLAVCVLYREVYIHLGPGRYGTLLALRISACFLLLLILFKPAILFPTGLAGQLPTLAILVDSSASMATADEPNLPGRYAQTMEMLRSQVERIRQNFRPIWIPFATKAGLAYSLAELGKSPPTGLGSESTDIASAIGYVARLGKLAGVILISDGIANTPGDPARQAAELGVPIYALAVGATKTPRAGPICNCCPLPGLGSAQPIPLRLSPRISVYITCPKYPAK
jgi:hypothetical protein